jgi:phosphinothricin acetyltransferase
VAGGGPVIRRACEADLAAITRIYDCYIVDSHVSFDLEPWSDERRRRWWDEHQAHDRLVVLVAEVDGEVVGTAYASWYRPKAGYERSVETSVVLDPGHTGRGTGTLLYGALLDALADAGTHRAYAVVALPNEASVALHRKLGFVEVGREDESGFKLGRYWSTVLLEKRF